MARTKTNSLSFGPFDHTETPIFPTSLVGVSADGRLYSEDGHVWVDYLIPLGPTRDAKTIQARLAVSAPLVGILTELANDTQIQGVRRRFTQKGNYRKIRVQVIDVEAMFDPPTDHPLRDLLLREYNDATRDVVHRRFAVLSIRLNQTTLGNSVAQTIQQLASRFTSGRADLSLTQKDFDYVESLVGRYGLAHPSKSEAALIRAWYNHGNLADIPYMPEANRLHLLRTDAAATQAQKLYADGVPLEKWPILDGHSVLTFAALSEFDMPRVTPVDPRASWALQLIDAGASCVSITGFLEPGRITAAEIDRNRTKYMGDIDEGVKFDKSATPEQLDKLALLETAREEFAGSGAPPSLIDTSIVVAFNGDAQELAQGVYDGFRLAPLTNRQVGAWAETFSAPSTRANPMSQDVPVPLLAYSGVCSLSTVGDPPRGSAMIGYTETDRQPVWANVTAANTNADLPPLYGVFGESGSGKTMLLLWMCIQHALLGHRGVFIDPKEGSDFTDVVHYYGGEVRSLADLSQSSGIVDPLRLTDDANDGVNMAISILSYVMGWGGDNSQIELVLSDALRTGIGLGHSSIMTCLRSAKAAGVQGLTDELMNSIERFRTSVAFGSAIIGDSDDAPRLAMGSNLTLIRMGNLSLEASGEDIASRATKAMIRLLVRGSAIAVRGNDGFVALDEAWIFFEGSEDELVSLGRLARSQRVSVFFGSQKVTDARRNDGKMKTPLSSGWILSMSNDPSEARAACEWLKIPLRDDLMARITAKPFTTSTDGRQVPNFHSLKSLVVRNPITGATQRVVRGSVALTADVADRVVATEIRLPDVFLSLASTNGADRDERERVSRGAHTENVLASRP